MERRPERYGLVSLCPLWRPQVTTACLSRDADGSSNEAGRATKTINADEAGDGVLVTFDEPGTYVLRCLASDGALADDYDVTVTVTS